MQDNFNKLKLEAESSKAGISSKLDELHKNLESLEKEIDTMQVALKTNDDKIAALEQKSQDLNSELTNLKQEHQNLSQETETKERELSQLQADLEEKQHNKNSLEAEISNREKQLTELNMTVKQLEMTIAEVKDKLLNAEQIREEKVGVIEKEVQETKDKTERKTNQYKILKHFLETEYVSDSHFDVVKVLKQPGVTTIDQLVLSSGVGRAAVEETLNDLQKKGVVAIDGKKFSIEKEFSI